MQNYAFRATFDSLNRSPQYENLEATYADVIYDLEPDAINVGRTRSTILFYLKRKTPPYNFQHNKERLIQSSRDMKSADF